MKPLKPSMRENKRYLFIKCTDGGINKNITDAILEFTGINGMSKTGLKFISHDSKNGSAIISINRESIDVVRASLCIWPKKISVEKISGTLKSLRRKIKPKTF